MDFINRELSWVDFNERVLLEAVNPENPLVEQLNFMSISSSNMDEFFMVRIGKLERKKDAGRTKPDPSGLTPAEQLEKASQKAKKLIKKQYDIYNSFIIPRLKEEGIELVSSKDIDKAEKKKLFGLFKTQIEPVLTPRVLNPKYPFPLLTAKRLYISALVKHEDHSEAVGLIPVPAGIKRLVVLSEGTKVRAMLLEDIISLFIGELYKNAKVNACMPFRITRNTDFLLDISSVDKIIEEMEKTVKRRSYGKPVRIEMPENGDNRLKNLIQKLLGASSDIVIPIQGPLDLTFLAKEVRKLKGFGHLRYKPFTPRIQPRLKDEKSIFDIIKDGDLLLHHPFDDYSAVVRFVKEAVEDPDVLAIKQTLYRVAGSKPFIALLAQAAQLGKQVTVLVEVRARFDEENNINWVRALEKAGCNVVYGSIKWKTHSKITMVVRREDDGLRQYMHLATGNYNDATAKAYTDVGLLTCDRQLARDGQAYFNILSGFVDTFPMTEIVESPYSFRDSMTNSIRREKENALKGSGGLIVAKMNSLSDAKIIKELYEAADAGAYVYLMIRGVCCLKVPEHGRIVVRSIVGRYLEHARIFVFYNEGLKDTYISSADWMKRNLDKRLELTIPIKENNIAKKLHDILATEFSDNTQAWQMQADGTYKKIPQGENKISSQEEFMQKSQPPFNFDEVFYTNPKP
ncbi:MAG: polyphosphate kinase 1 [Eubacteriales bacterium]|nr:polyphosphate kinase 1 [Eubacteriales bacterium]